MKNIKILVGLPITFIFLAILCGGVQAAVSLLLMSIICTFGISLVFWVPVCWGVGWITIVIYEAIAQQAGWSIPSLLRREETTSSHQTDSFLTHEQIAMVKYVRQCISCGFSDEKIINRLRRQGWSDEDINRAYEVARNS